MPCQTKALKDTVRKLCQEKRQNKESIYNIMKWGGQSFIYNEMGNVWWEECTRGDLSWEEITWGV